MSEINVTPFVDVMLVLLIIFMVAAPLLTPGVEVDLPDSAAGALPADDEEPLVVSVTSDGSITIQTTGVSDTDFLSRLQGIMVERNDDRIFLQADGQISYERVMQVMGAMEAAGFGKISLVTESGGPDFQATDG